MDQRQRTDLSAAFAPYERSAAFYDAANAAMGKSYEREADQLRALISERAPDATSWLDVACGTGLHMQAGRGSLHIEGVEPDAGLRSICVERLPGVAIHDGDMRTFNLGRTFDVVTCLFSAIGYMHTLEDLHAAVSTMAAHVAPGGLLVIEPWFRPGQWFDGMVSCQSATVNGLAVSRMSTSTVDEQGRSQLDFHWQVARGITMDQLDRRESLEMVEAVEYEYEAWVESHRLAMWTDDDYLSATENAGLQGELDPTGLIGRGLILGTRASS